MARASLPAVAVTALLALATPAAGSWAEAGDSPAAAHVKPSRDWAYAVALQRDGKVVAAGRSVGGGWRFALARYTTRGQLDPSFGQGGKVLTDVGSSGYASALAIQRDGRIVAAGHANVGREQDVAVVRYTPRGRLDSSFGRSGRVLTDFSPTTRTYDRTRGLALQRDGELLLAGESVSSSVDSGRRVLARYTGRGRLDRGFGAAGIVLSRAGPYEGAGGVAIQRDGKIVAAGSGRVGFALTRYTARGRLDRRFGLGGTVSTKLASFTIGHDVAIEPDGKIVVVGDVGGDFGIVRYTDAGRLDRSFGNGGKVVTNLGFITETDGSRDPSGDRALNVAIQADGKLVVAGSSNALGLPDVWDFALVRYAVDGSLDPSFGNGGKVLTHFVGNSSAEGLVIQPDGEIVAAGGGAGYFVLARYTRGGKLDPTFGRGGKVQTTLRP
jgi:uncharacterized delta-60 repeat protein